MNANVLQYMLDPSLIMHALGKPADEWQRKVLFSTKNLILNCCRQAGKSTIIGVKAAAKALFSPGSLTLIVSKSQRQAGETLRKALDAYYALDAPVPIRHVSTLYLELENGSRIVSLPGKEGTIRGYSGVALLIIDEASRVPEDIYNAVRPMLAISNGQCCILSTPFGQRGFFYREWIGKGASDWERIKVSANEIPRFRPNFLADELLSMGETMYQQEYFNQFGAVEGLVFPRFKECLVESWPFPEGTKIGGIDWGWRNPFAAVWGVHERATDILWIKSERYLRGTPLHVHRDALKPLRTTWIADPAGATERTEFLAGDLKVWNGDNDIKAGIAAVTARIETGRLKIYSPECHNLVEESQLYRYPDKREFHPEPEKPVDEFNHALSALRYLISKLDARFMAKWRRKPLIEVDLDSQPVKREARPTPNWTRRLRNPALWVQVN